MTSSVQHRLVLLFVVAMFTPSFCNLQSRALTTEAASPTCTEKCGTGTHCYCTDKHCVCVNDGALGASAPTDWVSAITCDPQPLWSEKCYCSADTCVSVAKNLVPQPISMNALTCEAGCASDEQCQCSPKAQTCKCDAHGAFDKENILKWAPHGKANTEFDLTKLIGVSTTPNVLGKTYTLNDANRYNATSGTYQWHYVFALQGTVEPTELPDSCPTVPKYAVYQVAHDKKSCFGLGEAAASAQELKIKLRDANAPAQGFQITYEQGESCGHRNRSFTINFQCAEDEAIVPTTLVDSVSEGYGYNMCRYETTIKTREACPLSCLDESDTLLCSGRGSCSYDPDLVKGKPVGSKCFCDKNFVGPMCRGECPDDCANNGMCGWSDHLQAARCFCDMGFGGSECESIVPLSVQEAEIQLVSAEMSEDPERIEKATDELVEAKAADITYHTEHPFSANCAAPWVLCILLLIALVAGYVRHRMLLELPLNPCADVLYPANVPAGGDYSAEANGAGDYAKMGGETGAI